MNATNSNSNDSTITSSMGINYDTSIYPLIYCSDAQTCSTVEPLNGYYLNADSNEETNTIIRCSNQECEAEAPESSCIDGKVLKDVENEYYLCISSNTDPEEKIKISLTGNLESYITINVEENIFPGMNSAGDIGVKIRNDGSVILLETATLPPCDLSDENTEYPSEENACTSGTTIVNSCILYRKIYETDESQELTYTCKEISGSSTSEIIYFDNEYKRVNTPLTLESNIYLAYHCTFTESEFVLNSCELAKGYFEVSNENSLIISCNGWKGDGCMIDNKPSESDCSSNTVEGKYINNLLCFSHTTVALQSDSDEKLIAFKLTKISSIFCKMPNDIVFLSLSDKQAIEIIPTLSGILIKKYYYNK